MASALVSSSSDESNCNDNEITNSEANENNGSLERSWQPSGDAWKIVRKHFRNFREVSNSGVWRKVGVCNVDNCKTVLRDRSTQSFKRHLKDGHSIETPTTPASTSENRFSSIINYFTPKVIFFLIVSFL